MNGFFDILIVFLQRMSRVLAIDYGRKRSGIAVTDVLQLIPNGLTTVSSNQLLQFVSDYVDKDDAVL